MANAQAIIALRLDVLSDTFEASRRFRMLAVNDDCCRETLCPMADTSISGARVAREMDALVHAMDELWSHCALNRQEMSA